ncbi:MAG TPA: LPS export ABC transporter periplasmic protein LptC [Chitinivibrionales bacterium]|nr:LPS export ABC transporter periplasmic protein LptC [Chitinivibrionales bacterium]
MTQQSRIVLLFTLSLLMGCAQKNETVPVSNAVIDRPFQEIDSSTMYYYNAGRLQWKLDSKHMKKFIADTGHILANPVKLNVFDSLGKVSSIVLSDSGYTDAAMKNFCVWGNVFVRAQNGVKVTSKRLYWNLVTHRITSADTVYLKTPKGDQLQGRGFDAMEDFSMWTFQHEVQGRFVNFKERVDKGDMF